MVMFWRNFAIFFTVLSLGGIVVSINDESYELTGLFIVMAIMQSVGAYEFHKKGI